MSIFGTRRTNIESHQTALSDAVATISAGVQQALEAGRNAVAARGVVNNNINALQQRMTALVVEGQGLDRVSTVAQTLADATSTMLEQLKQANQDVLSGPDPLQL